MGNQSSQLQVNGEMPQRNSRVIGPSMSPTPEPEENQAVPIDGSSVDREMAQPDPNERPSKKRKKKKKKQKLMKGSDGDPGLEDTLAAGDEETEAHGSTKKRKKKRRKSLDSEPASQEASVAGDEVVIARDTTKKSKNKKSRNTLAEDEEEVEDAVIQDTQIEHQVQSVEEPHPSPKRKKKRPKKTAAHDNELPRDDTREQGLVNGDNTLEEAEAAQEDGSHVESALLDDFPGHAPDGLQNPAPGKKKRRQHKTAGESSSSDIQQLLVSHAVGGSPPSAQPPEVNSILKDEPLVDDVENDVAVIPSSQRQPPRRESTQSIEPIRLKREPSDGNSDYDDQLQFHFAGIAAANFADAVTDPVAEAMRENDPENGLGWLHKRENAPQETPIMGARASQLDLMLPNSQPSQIKTEARSDSESDSESSSESDASSSESNSHSPSVQKFERLSRSRSRSASRATSRSGYLADHALGLSVTARPDPYEQIPYSPPSSTGSNRSIPARLPSPSTTGSNRSIPAYIEPQPSPSRISRQASNDDAPADADAMDVDQPMVRDTSPSKKSAENAALDRKKNTIHPAQHDEADAVNLNLHELNKDKSQADRHDAQANSDIMEIDQSFVAEEFPSPNNRRTKKATPGKPKNVARSTQPSEAEGGIKGADVAAPAAKPKRQNRRLRNDDKLADKDTHLMANGGLDLENDIQQSRAEASIQNDVSDDEIPLEVMPAADEVGPNGSASHPSKSKKRQAKASLVHNDVAPSPASALKKGTTIAGPTLLDGVPMASPKKKGSNRARKSASVDAPEGDAKERQSANYAPTTVKSATALSVDSVEPRESASQPQLKSKTQGKKKRMLVQSKASLSLSQIEGDEVEEDFSTTFARKKGAKAGVNNEPEQSEVGGSQAPSPEKQRKPKRKRRTTDNASEDEMESLLAAGPSKGRKTVSNLGLSDRENGREAKRKRLSSGKATGAWAQDELNDLGKVVEDFMDEHNMTQQEINQLIQQVPSKSDPVNKDFWDKADQAIPQRTRKQITERARRIYHNFVARGTWTEEQKDEVHELFESHPKKWAEIAGMINRDQKDVRDYWRNSYLVLESQIKSRWSKDEEEKLREIMEEALSRIRITRENSDQPRQGSRSKSIDDEAMIDWQQISAAMDLTRSRQQCRWKWVDMREKGLVGDDSIALPTQPRSSAGPSGRMINGISEELANAREDYRGMGPEEKFRLIDAIKDSGAREDKNIPWRTLVDERFRTKWHRPALRLTWYRLRQTVPDYEEQDVEANARHLVNYYHMHQMLPRFDDNQANEQIEEQVIHYNRGKRIWKRPSGDLRAVRERQRRSSSASSRASSRLSRKVSSEILNLSDDEAEAGRSRFRQSAELGEERGRRARRDGLKSDEVSVNIPGHLKGEAAKKALAQARAKAKGKARETAATKGSPVRSNSVAVDSDSD